MKLVLIAAVSLLASCKDKPRESSPVQGSSSGPSPGASPASPAPAPSAAADPAVPDICKASLASLDGTSCTAPEIRQNLFDAKKAISGVVETIGKIGSADPRQFQVMCAQMLLAIERDVAKLKCAVAIDPRQRAEITAFLDAWYGQRTPVVPTGDSASDAMIARIVAVRDAACQCRDAACLDRVDKQLAEIGDLPATATPAARTLGSKLLEDAGRCASRVRTLGDSPR
jgi:hypothetical protein